VDGRSPSRHTPPMTCARVTFSAVVLLAATSSIAASQPVISDDLQQEAMTCVGEAMKFCPDVWTAEDHGLACMTGKRQSFSPRCRVIYDKVARVLHQHDHAEPHQSPD